MKHRYGPLPEEESETPSGTPLGVQILAFICGLVVVFLGFKSIHQDYASIKLLTRLDQFTQTPGKLLQVKVRHDTASGNEEFYPDMLFEFFVEGKSIWGWRLSFEEKPGSREYWENRLKGYAVGDPVTVFYNPAVPKDAILEKKHDGLYRTWMKMLLGFGFFLAGMLLTVLPAGAWLKNLLKK